MQSSIEQQPDEQQPDHRRFHAEHEHLGSAFGSDNFGILAERTARFFGTPVYLIGQTAIVVAWITINAVGVVAQWDPYPFILLNLVFSTQAAYAAPLILLASTRQAERDKAWSAADAKHREDLSTNTLALLQQNTELTEQIASMAAQLRQLTDEIHRRVVEANGNAPSV
jgi:uncharacterized membrane protein